MEFQLHLLVMDFYCEEDNEETGRFYCLSRFDYSEEQRYNNWSISTDFRDIRSEA